MIIWYAAKERFGTFSGDAWTKYIEWAKLYHLKEVITLDPMICPDIYEPDFSKEETYSVMLSDERGLVHRYCHDFDYMVERIKNIKDFNFLALKRQPTEACENITLPGFKFIGYDLLDFDHSASALTNCGGFDETFSAAELNRYGLLSQYTRAIEVQKDLLANNPDEIHADCLLWALWLHETIGR